MFFPSPAGGRKVEHALLLSHSGQNARAERSPSVLVVVQLGQGGEEVLVHVVK